MKSIILALLILPCALYACQNKHKPNIPTQPTQYECENQPELVRENVLPILFEWDGHLWKAIMLEHSTQCGCGLDKEGCWPEYDYDKEPVCY